MFCKNCGNKLNEGCRFCNKCGVEIIVEKESQINKTKKECKKETIKKMVEHLEFLGYKTELLEAEKDFVVAINPNKSNLIIRDIIDGVVMISIRLITKAKEQNEEVGLMLNEINKAIFLSRCFVETDKETSLLILNFESTFVGDYNKENFSIFLDLLNNDASNIHNIKNLNKIF